MRSQHAFTHSTGSPVIPLINPSSIRKRRKRGLYVLDVWLSGRHIKKALKTTNRKEAERRAAIALNQLLAGDGPAGNPSFHIRSAGHGPSLAQATAPQVPPRAGISDLVAEYLQAKQNDGMSYKTIQAYKLIGARFCEFCRTLGLEYLDQLSAAEFQAFKVWLKQKTPNAKTLQNQLVNLLSWAKWVFDKKGIGTRSVFHGCVVPKAPEPTRFVPVLEDVKTMIAAAPPAIAAYIQTFSATGLRLAELQHLRVVDIDLHQDVILVRSRQTPHRWVTKTNEDRSIPIHQSLLPVIQGLVKEATAHRRAYLFCAPKSLRHPKGDYHCNARTVSSHIKAIARQAGIRVDRANQGFTTHALRRYFATRCLSTNLNQLLIDRWMGHTNRTMANRYIQQAADVQQSEMNRVEFF
jgi:integrase